MWIIINVILLLVGACLIVYAKHIDSSENYEALYLAILGVVFLLVSGVSSFIKWLI